MKIFFYFIPIFWMAITYAMDLEKPAAPKTGYSVEARDVHNKRAAKKTLNEQQQSHDCRLSCDAYPRLLSALNPLVVSQNRALQSIQINGMLMQIPRRIAELSNTLRPMLNGADEKSCLHYFITYPQTMDCFIQCLKGLANITNHENYGLTVHQALRLHIKRVNIVHLLITASHFDVPVLIDYLTSIIATYLVQESDMDRLGNFVIVCNELLSPDLLSKIAHKILQTRPVLFMQFFCREFVHNLSEVPRNSLIHFTLGDSALMYSWYQRESYLFTSSIFELNDNKLNYTRSLSVGLKDFGRGFLNNRGNRLIFNTQPLGKEWEAGPIYEIDMMNSQTPDIVDSGANYKRNLSLGGFDRVQANGTQFKHANYPETIIFPGLLIAYNGKYALTRNDALAILWRMEGDGTPILVRDSIKLKISATTGAGSTEAVPTHESYEISNRGKFLFYSLFTPTTGPLDFDLSTFSTFAAYCDLSQNQLVCTVFQCGIRFLLLLPLG